MGYLKLPGRSVDEHDLIAAPQECLRLGEFLDRLHRFPLDKARRWGLDAETPQTWRAGWRRAWLRYRRALVLLPHWARPEAERRWNGYLKRDENFDFEPALIHADVTPQHVLWKGGRISGVIDWSDAQIGDVAMDLAWPSMLPQPTLATILAPYSARDLSGLKTRARFYEWTGWWSEAVHGLETGELFYAERGVAGIMRQLPRT